MDMGVTIVGPVIHQSGLSAVQFSRRVSVRYRVGM